MDQFEDYSEELNEIQLRIDKLKAKLWKVTDEVSGTGELYQRSRLRNQPLEVIITPISTFNLDLN